MNKLGGLGCVAVIGSTLLLGCSSEPLGQEGSAANSTRSDETVATTGAALKRAVQPGVSSPIWLETLPNATCQLHAAGALDPAHNLTIYSDNRGALLLYVQPKAADTDEQLALDCEDAHGAHDAPRVRISSTRSAPEPKELDKLEPPRELRTARPLLQGDLMAPNMDELLAQGALLRPDPATHAKEFQEWKDVVSTPINVVSTPPVIDGTRFHHLAMHDGSRKAATRSSSTRGHTSGNWSGWVLSAFDVYLWTQGFFHVPTVTGDDANEDLSSLWVGIDGWFDGSLPQAGTDQLIYHTFFGNIFVYQTWVEYFPDTAQIIGGMTTAPDDYLFVQVALTDANRNIVAKGGYATITVVNGSRGTSWNGVLQAPSGHAVPGDPRTSSAEFIMEKFEDAGHMAHYTGSINAHGLARLQSGALQSFYDSPSFEVDLVNGSTGHKLSEGTGGPSQFKIGFQWDAFW